MKYSKVHCLDKISDDGEWEFKDSFRAGALLGLTHFINKNVEEDVTEVCIVVAPEQFGKDTIKFNKASYREFEETLYVSELGTDMLVATGWILSDLIPGSVLVPDCFYIKLIKI